MRMLTVQQPAAGAIVALGKDVEGRTWPTTYEGLIAIHAGLSPMPNDHPFREFPVFLEALAGIRSPADEPAFHHRGAIIAVAWLAKPHTRSPGCCASPWGRDEAWPWHWPLVDVRPLPVPVPATGGLGLRRMVDAVERRVLEALS